MEGLRKNPYFRSTHTQDLIFVTESDPKPEPWLKKGILPPHKDRWYVVPADVMVSFGIKIETYDSDKFAGVQFTVKYLHGTVDKDKHPVYALQWK